jgi:GTP-binding protein
LVINKTDLLASAEVDKRAKDIVRRLRWKGPVLKISGATGAGTEELKQAVMRYLEEHPREVRTGAIDDGAADRPAFAGAMAKREA